MCYNSSIPATVVCGVGRTKQKTGMEHDINKIVARAKQTGVLPMAHDDVGTFIDVATVGDFTECQNRIVAAQDAFMRLPSAVRGRFGNDPVKFMDYMHTLSSDKMDEAIKLGLVEKPKPVAKEPDAVKPDDKAVVDSQKDGDQK